MTAVIEQTDRARKAPSFVKGIAGALAQMFLPPKRFAAEGQEKAFLTEYGERFVAHRRAALVLALITWASYFGWDYYHSLKNLTFQQAFPLVVGMRAVGGALLLGGLVASRSAAFERESYATTLICTCVVVCYALLLLMIALVPFAFNYLFYFCGLPLVLSFTFGLLRLRARPVFAAMVICLAASCVVLPVASSEGAVLLNEVSSMLGFKKIELLPADGIIGGAESLGGDKKAALAEGDKKVLVARKNTVWSYYYLSALTYLLSFAVIGCVVAVEMERTARNAFLRERALADSERETESKATTLVSMKEQLRLAAERQNQDKSKFLADAAHDLSQPLQVLSSYLTVAATHAERGDADKAAEAVGSAQLALQRSLTSFHDVLEISRLETGHIQPTYSRFDINALVDEVLASLAPSAKAKGVALTRYPRRSEPTYVRSDWHQLSRVVTNLVSNAVKYSRPGEGARVLVGVIRFSGRVRIDIYDNGIGIPAEKLTAVFKPFVQLHNPERNREKGVGLGLSIVSAIIALLEGHRIDLSSREGKGTRFSIDVPRGDMVDGEALRLPTTPGEAAEPLHGLYVLYVEDDASVRSSVEALLEIWGALFEVYDSAEELEERIGRIERVPDLVLTDYRLPNGRTAQDVARIVETAFQEPLPMLVMTGEVTDFSGAEWLKAGKVLRKPVTPEALRREISELLRAHAPAAAE